MWGNQARKMLYGKWEKNLHRIIFWGKSEVFSGQKTQKEDFNYEKSFIKRARYRFSVPEM